jgi:hypothetical protein
MGDAMTKDYSQFGEQRILEGILGKLDLLDATVDGRFFVDVGAADGKTCSNTRFLLDHNWGGLLIESDCMRLQEMCHYLCDHRKARPWLAHVTCEPGETLDDVLAAAAVKPADVTLLSIDIDGLDYWVWLQTTLRPPVVVIEYNPNYGPDENRAVCYDARFRWEGDDYFGATALALWELGLLKRYQLVAHTTCNLIFVRVPLQLGCDFKMLTPCVIPKVQLNPPSKRRLVDLR